MASEGGSKWQGSVLFLSVQEGCSHVKLLCSSRLKFEAQPAAKAICKMFSLLCISYFCISACLHLKAIFEEKKHLSRFNALLSRWKTQPNNVVLPVGGRASCMMMAQPLPPAPPCISLLQKPLRSPGRPRESARSSSQQGHHL